MAIGTIYESVAARSAATLDKNKNCYSHHRYHFCHFLWSYPSGAPRYDLHR